MSDTVGPRPHFVRLEREARGAWQALVDRLTLEMNDPDFPPQLRGPWSKLKVYAARLALIVHLLRWVKRLMKAPPTRKPPGSQLSQDGRVRAAR